jgi:quercetin dioxygenase-like cupin family protein
MPTPTTNVIRAAARATKQQPNTNFTGVVFADEVVVGEKPSRMRGTRVTFTPGARTNWHTHALGQVLWCLHGTGRVQQEGQAVIELLPGDTVTIPPDVRHWHGSAPGYLFAHLALSEMDDKGQGTVWLEPVSDADYNKKPG